MAIGEPHDADDRAAFAGARIRAEPRRDALHRGLAVLLLGLTVGGYFFAGFPGALVWLAGIAAPALALLAWQRARTPEGGGRIEAGPEGLFADGKLLVARADMTRAVVVPSEGGALVSVQRKQGFFVAVQVPSAAEGERLVSALGLAVDQKTAEFMVDSPLAVRLPVPVILSSLAVLLVIAMVGIAKDYPAAFLGLAGWYALFLAWARPATLTIGTDGLLLSWFGRKTLVPFSSMVSCAEKDGALRIGLASGRSIRVRAAWTARQRSRWQPEFASESTYLEALAERIRQAREAAGGADIAVLDRRGKPFVEWMGHLRALTLRDAPGFREAPVVPEALWKTVENGHAEPRVRAAAAVALGVSLDEAGKERLRVAARVVVAPRLRVALTAAADGDEEALSAALAELESAAPRRARA